MAYPELLRKPNLAARELQHTDFEAVEQENERLRELVVQLSKLVVKYVIAGTSAVDSGRPAAIQAPGRQRGDQIALCHSRAASNGRKARVLGPVYIRYSGRDSR